MKNIILFAFSFVLLFSCGEEVKEKNTVKEDLVVIKNGIYTEYYPGKKNIKYQGAQDDQHKREGRWVYFSDKGEELSVTMYSHGLKDGFSMVKYPNGVLHYTGEYMNDTMVGIWRTYNIKGKLAEEKNYDIK
jgi:antitoxin component YwqK of YwqJK toxin-antitoxin module